MKPTENQLKEYLNAYFQEWGDRPLSPSQIELRKDLFVLNLGGSITETKIMSEVLKEK